ncbi:MAG: C40 family peptidase [Pyrinomonadaceae bacterium]
MSIRNLSPRVLAVSLFLGVCSLPIFAQEGLRLRITATRTDEITCAPEDFSAVTTIESNASTSIKRIATTTRTPAVTTNAVLNLQPLLLAAIDQRLGAPYSWGAEGPNAFDCSGFVWSIFQSAGITFERGSARTLWARFLAPPPDEQYKFGTLVFFSGLAHVGVVADEHGFYHASRHHGVVYAPFNDYWLSRVDGFRRVPLPTPQVTD